MGTSNRRWRIARAGLFALLGAAVLAPSAQADGLVSGLTPVTQAAGSTVSTVTQTATGATTQAAKTPTTLVTNVTKGTPVAQPVADATKAVPAAANDAGGAAQQAVQTATTVTAAAVETVAPVVDNAAGAAPPPADGLVQPVAETVRDTVSTAEQAVAPVTRTVGGAASSPPSSDPQPPAQPAVALAGAQPGSMAAPVPVSVAPSATGPLPAGEQTPPAAWLSAPVERVADTGAAPLRTALVAAPERVAGTAENAATAARDAVRTAASGLASAPRLPLGTPDTPAIGGSPAGGTILLLLAATLLSPFVLVAPRSGRRLRPACDLMRPPAFVSLLERPG